MRGSRAGARGRRAARRRTALALGVALLGPTLAGACSSDADEPAAPTAEATGDCPAGRTDGTLTVGLQATPSRLDPAVAGTRGTAGGIEMAAIYDTLTRYDEASGTYEPNVAESLEPNEDATEWTLTLRDGVTFADGERLTTAAVEFSIERITAEGSTSSYKSLALAIEQIDIVDDRTMTFHLDGPWGGFPSLLGKGPGMVVNPALFDAGDPDVLQAPPLGAGVGPFTLERFEPGEELVLARRDGYWDGPVCLAELRLVNVGGASETYDAFRAGELDVASLRDAPIIREARDADVEHHSTLSNGGGLLLLNNGTGESEPPTTDVRVRQAIAHAIDPELIDQRSTGGVGMPTSAIIHEASIFYQGLEGPPFDPDLASDLVEEVKAEGAWDGSIRLTCQNEPTSVEAMITVAGLLTNVGFEVELDNAQATSEMITQVAVNHDYEISCWSLSVSDSSPWADIAPRFAGTDNFIGYQNPEMDAALGELKAAVSIEDQQAALARVQEVANDTVPVAVYGAAEDVLMWSDQVDGIGFMQDAIATFAHATVEAN